MTENNPKNTQNNEQTPENETTSQGYNEVHDKEENLVNETKHLSKVPLICFAVLSSIAGLVIFYSLATKGQTQQKAETDITPITKNSVKQTNLSQEDITSTMTYEKKNSLPEKNQVESNGATPTEKIISQSNDFEKLPHFTKENFDERPEKIELLPERPEVIADIPTDARFEEFKKRREQQFIVALTSSSTSSNFQGISKTRTSSFNSGISSNLPQLPPNASYDQKRAYLEQMQNLAKQRMMNNSTDSGYSSKLAMAQQLMGQLRASTNSPASNNLPTNNVQNSFNENNNVSVNKANFDGDKWSLGSSLENAKSYTINTGFVIPATTITGINSDLAGAIIAQVSQNVYDTSTGRHLLIPQGTKIYGQYSSGVMFQQERLFVAWNRLVYPDGKTLDLGAMSGADLAGYSGFSDLVNNHYWSLFKSAFLLSMVTASVTYADNEYGNQDYDSNHKRASSAMSESLGTELGNVTTELIRKHMNVSPTIEIRPGYKFNVIVSKDIQFNQPYKAWN